MKTILHYLPVVFLMVLTPCEASQPDGRDFETISIFADVASEDTEPGVLHFEGHFSMKTPHWQLESDGATVYGNLDQPDRVHLSGAPARFLADQDAIEGAGKVQAESQEMDYLRSTRILKLSGGALLRFDDETVRSTVIEYNIDTRRYRAGGGSGVLIEVPPDG